MVGAAMTMTTMTTIGTAPLLMTNWGTTAVDDRRENLATATWKHRQWGQLTANNNCHRKRQEWAGADDKGNQQEQVDDDGE